MRNNTVEILDKNGQILRLYISIPSILGIIKDSFAGEKQNVVAGLTGSSYLKPFFDQLPGYWKVLNSQKKLIKFFAGSVLKDYDNYKDLTTQSIVLVNLEGTWGITLFNYFDVFGVNEYGKGTAVISWVSGLAEGRFAWSIVD